jgi:hypothetical protein
MIMPVRRRLACTFALLHRNCRLCLSNITG